MTFVRRTEITRGSLFGLGLCAAALCTPAGAAQLNLPDNNAVDYSTFARRPVDLSLEPSSRQSTSTDQPGVSFLGTKLNFTDGQIQLYHFRLDKTPFNTTLPPQQIDAGGVKLKWTW
jgi:hypothetical protein